ncbi:tetratricopeptide repeat protein [Phaeovulum sp. NW3]|uniref:tetratricopeptide repeat protein n=1 Tax=Phaeovulum sp. NW3 TaxID=2934933 RepID=UPI002020B961|nr:tetratricopeptide repeat protein [Phaeovulum sp. NW3]MCL7464695.1 sel1 repeat family protein [Phaeovulum sp. NW3]
MTPKGTFRATGVCAALFLGTAIAGGAITPAFAQDAAATQTATPDAAALRTRGEALIYGLGDVAQDVPAGLSLLDQAASAGDIAAKAALGKILLDGYYTQADSAKGTRLLQEAAADGNAAAQRNLGKALLWGTGLAADPTRAQTLLDQAASAGDAEARRVLGEQLIGGWVLPADATAGQALLEQSAAAGDTQAQVTLGALLLHGTGLPKDESRALELFEQAAAAGDGAGLERFGATLMWRQRDPAAAEAYLRRAGELGRGTAWVTLAEGAMYGFLGEGSRQKFDGFAQQARAAGEGRIEVLEAQRRTWGISMVASGPETLAGLERAAEAGNKDALLYLIGLVRNGNRYNIRKEPDRALAYLDRFANLLSAPEIERLRFSIDAARVKTIPAYEVLAARLAAKPDLLAGGFGPELAWANDNFAIYLLQTRLQAEGRYSGPINGLATRATLRALYDDCKPLMGPVRCGDDILKPEVLGRLLNR